MVCFEDRLATEWYRIYQAIETVVDGQISKNLCNISFSLKVPSQPRPGNLEIGHFRCNRNYENCIVK